MAFNMWDYMNDESKKAADTADTKLVKIWKERDLTRVNFWLLDSKQSKLQ